MWLEFFSFPTFIHHLSLQSLLPSFPPSIAELSGVTTNLISFQALLCKNQRKSSPDTKQTHKTNPASPKWNPTRCCFCFTTTAIFFPITLLLPVISHWSLLLFSSICQQISHLLGLSLLFALFSSDPGLSFRALLAELQLCPLLLHVCCNHRGARSENIVDLLLVWLF